MTICEKHIEFKDDNCDDCQKEWAEQTGQPLTPEQEFPREDWQYDVANGDTKLGYADWVAHNVEANSDPVKRALPLLLEAYKFLCDAYDREELSNADVTLKSDIAVVLLRAGLLQVGR